METTKRVITLKEISALINSWTNPASICEDIVASIDENAVAREYLHIAGTPLSVANSINQAMIKLFVEVSNQPFISTQFNKVIIRSEENYNVVAISVRLRTERKLLMIDISYEYVATMQYCDITNGMLTVKTR
jgi:hypothetical protein